MGQQYTQRIHQDEERKFVNNLYKNKGNHGQSSDGGTGQWAPINENMRSRVPVVNQEEASVDEQNDVVNEMFNQNNGRKKKKNVKTNKNFKEPSMSTQRVANVQGAYKNQRDGSQTRN